MVGRSNLIQTHNLNLIYKDGKSTFHALKDINLAIPDNGFYGIIGPSGSGKTSLLYVLSGIRQATDGQVLFAGEDITKAIARRSKLRRQNMGFVFQFHFLINYLNVEQNILVGATEINSETKKRAAELMEQLDIQGLNKRKPFALSGGQRQRVAIARSLINQPKVVFLDEPTASLDHQAGQNVMQILRSLTQNTSIVVVTHDPSILTEANQVFEMWDGQLK